MFLTHQAAGCVSGMLSGDGHEIKIYARELETALLEGQLPLMKTDKSRWTEEEAASFSDE
ncbi:hypothetical protein UM89_19670 [Bacillus subtilis]|nr:hypothetical protein UM89_19670 [Bacillus subtilis]